MLGIILLLERCAEQGGECLIELGLETAYECPDKVIAGLVALAVNMG